MLNAFLSDQGRLAEEMDPEGGRRVSIGLSDAAQMCDHCRQATPLHTLHPSRWEIADSLRLSG